MLDVVFAEHPRVLVSNSQPVLLQQILLEESSTEGQMQSKFDVTYVGIMGSDVAVASAENREWIDNIYMTGQKLTEKENAPIGSVKLVPASSFIIGVRQQDTGQVEHLHKLGQRACQVVCTDYPTVSSSQVRRRVANGERIEDLVPKAVEKLIEEKRWYELQAKL